MNLAYASAGHSQFKPPGIPEVYVVNGDASEREALQSLIHSAGWQPRAAASAKEFLALPPPAASGCLVAELHLPDMSGLDLQQRIVDRTEMPVIFMSSHADVPATVRAMKAGAFEFLAKPFTRELMLDAIGRAIEHSQATLHRLAQIRALQQRCESLSQREREVMSLVVSGRMNKQVSGELGIAEITVKVHRSNVMRKMKARSLAELVKMVTRLDADFMGADHLLRA